MTVQAWCWAARQTVGSPQAKLVLLLMTDAMSMDHRFHATPQGLRRLAEGAELTQYELTDALHELEAKQFIIRTSGGFVLALGVES